MKVRTRIKELLNERRFTNNEDISYADIAKATGLSRQVVYNWRDNEFENINISTAKKIAGYFNIDWRELFIDVPNEKG